MSIATRPLTYEALLATPDDGRRYEIHDGELVVAASPDWIHQKVISRFAFEVRLYLAQHDLPDDVVESPLDVRLFDHNIYQPDIVYISPERLHIRRPGQMPIEGAPDLLVEVLSPSSRTYDRRQKAAVYARSGVREFWILDPNAATIEVYRLRDHAYEIVPPVDGRFVSLVLPGFSVDPASIFADLA